MVLAQMDNPRRDEFEFKDPRAHPDAIASNHVAEPPVSRRKKRRREGVRAKFGKPKPINGKLRQSLLLR